MARNEKQEREDCAWEARVRREVLRRLEQPVKLAKAAVEKEKAKEEARRVKLAGYETEEDVQEAFGWGEIAESEYDDARRILSGEAIDTKKSEAQAVLETLQEICAGLWKELHGFEWEAMTPEQQEKCRAENEAAKERIKAALGRNVDEDEKQE